MALKFKSTLLLRFPHFTFCSSVYISNANFVLISGQAKSPKRLSLRVSARSSSILRKPRNANLSRPSTCRLVWRTTIPKRTSVSLAPLSTFHPICWGSRPGWRTLTQGLKNWVDGVKFTLLHRHLYDPHVVDYSTYIPYIYLNTILSWSWSQSRRFNVSGLDHLVPVLGQFWHIFDSLNEIISNFARLKGKLKASTFWKLSFLSHVELWNLPRWSGSFDDISLAIS